ncbi:MAG: hypothetical protein NZ927_02055 [Candidatus Calescibacterium sp.]|nr:hypothetical protein [Candidatus Calescibacterium sp.]
MIPKMKFIIEINSSGRDSLKLGINLLRNRNIFLYKANIYDVLIPQIPKYKIGEKRNGKIGEKLQKRKHKAKKIEGEKIKEKIYDLSEEAELIINALQKSISVFSYEFIEFEIPYKILDEPDLFPVFAFAFSIPNVNLNISDAFSVKIFFKVKLIQTIKVILLFLRTKFLRRQLM